MKHDKKNQASFPLVQKIGDTEFLQIKVSNIDLQKISIEKQSFTYKIGALKNFANLKGVFL